MLGASGRTQLQQLARDELPGLYALAWQLAGPDAEDLVQEALLRACKSFDQLREPEAAGRWFRVILTNVWRDRLRKDGREPDEVSMGHDESFSLYRTLVEEDPLPYSDTLHIDFLGAFSEHDVHEVLQRLPLRYRAPLVLRYVEGFSTQEVADLLELPHGTVLSQLHRGRQRFERELWEYSEESGLLDDTAQRPGEQDDTPQRPGDRARRRDGARRPGDPTQRPTAQARQPAQVRRSAQVREPAQAPRSATEVSM